MQFQQEIRASIQSLTNQMGQMATQLNQAQSQNSDKLPSQAMQNLRNVSAITLRSGKQTEVPIPVAEPTPKRDKEIDAQKRQPLDHAGPFSSNSDVRQPPIPLPFPPRAIPNKKMIESWPKWALKTFREISSKSLVWLSKS